MNMNIPLVKLMYKYYWDDQWLPYTEGHSGVELRMIKQDDNFYIGKVLSSWDKYDEELADYETGIGANLILEAQKINEMIADLFKLKYLEVESKLLFFTTAN